MELVDGGLEEVMAGLTTIWQTELAPRRTAVVLGDEDLPELPRPFLAGGTRIRPQICFQGWVAAGT
ncbi:MAG: hypothetical protein ACRYG2_11130 [Janthinobacterium lividum]